MLLSHTPLSCIIESKRDLANTLLSFTINPSISLQDQSTTTPMDIEVDTPKDQSSIYNINNSRELSVHSNTSFIA